MLLARVDRGHPLAAFDGYLDARESAARILRGAFEAEDSWFVTGDIVRVDPSGNHWFVDRAADMIRTHKGPVSTVQVEDALYGLPEIQQAVVYGLRVPGAEHEMPVATIVVRRDYPLDPPAIARQMERRLDANARPRFLRVRDQVPLSAGYRPQKQPLREEPLRPDEPGTWVYDQDLRLYQPLTPERYAIGVAQAGGRAPAGLAVEAAERHD
jgi:fatty-acyl-CoA synthase